MLWLQNVLPWNLTKKLMGNGSFPIIPLKLVSIELGLFSRYYELNQT